MMRVLCFLSLLTLGACAVRADQYWIAYEGNDFPEKQGWQRIAFGGGAQRWIENGVLVIDSRASTSIADFYQRRLNGNLDPDPGELFIMQWRLKIDEVIGFYDLGVSVRSDEKWAVGFHLNKRTIYSTFEPGVSASFAPGLFHEFEFRSSDMRRYALYIDDALAIEGSFWLSLAASRVGWGDTVEGASSLSRWDYLRFGVVPEPTVGALLALGSIAARRNLR